MCPGRRCGRASCRHGTRRPQARHIDIGSDVEECGANCPEIAIIGTHLRNI
ncbi:hypothetical protein T492DRAFT_112147 [Pavlovales sp. CCMP2436]|nr:hypothetical protein T492DRAFT_112147 [Pavlovales sp. CCMP2436]